MTLRFFVAGKPQTAGSKTAVPMGARMGVIEAGSKQSRARKRTWRGDLRDAALNAMEEAAAGMFVGEPLDLTLVIVRPRPSAHLRTGRNAGIVKDWAVSLQPVQRPDSTKIARAAEDALTGVLWTDDSQVVHTDAWKAYGDQCGLSYAAEGLFVAVKLAPAYGGPQLSLVYNPPRAVAV
jgi:Holliday junction resolvase RusA-like endonuclease